jgi:hypothetical protein
MEKHTVAELKDLCRSRGLKVGGTKRDLLARLAGEDGTSNPMTSSGVDAGAPPPPAKRARTTAASKPLTGQPTTRTMGKWLDAAGMPEGSWNKCAALAIARGHLRWNGTAAELDQPAVRADGSLLECRAYDPGMQCEHKWNTTLRSLLQQTDYPGLDYEDGQESATIHCPQPDCETTIYLSFMCEGRFEPDSGKFHNHCTKCKGLGKCIGDYRESHCSTCNKHFFEGLSGFGCPRCNPDDDSDGGGGGLFW